jgi:hypothetical protein
MKSLRHAAAPLTMDYTRLTLAEVRAALHDIARDSQDTFGRLSGEQLNWQPDQARWSVAQCFDHLLTTNALMLQAAGTSLDPSRPRTVWQRLPVLPGMFGRLMIRSLTPSATRKLKAPAAARPVFSEIPEGVVARFADQQREIGTWLETIDAPRAERTIVTSPFIRLITYSVLDACRLIVAHDHRHMQQARRVTAMPGFPGSSAVR